jgi:proteasome lid subunit RPN8/RPN11
MQLSKFFKPDTLSAIALHADSHVAEEVCGYVLNNDEVMCCENVAENKAEHFLIDPDVHDRAIAAGVKAIYHSHWSEYTDAFLSPNDINMSRAGKIPYLLYHTAFQEWDYYDPNDVYPYPLNPPKWTPDQIGYYLGWQFSYGRSDCWTLVRAWYKNKLGIELFDYPRGEDEDEIEQESWDLVEKSYKREGFRKLDRDEPMEEHDLLIMNLNGVQAHHLAIVTDMFQERGIHHFGRKNRLSDGFNIIAFRAFIVGVLRHAEVEVLP